MKRKLFVAICMCIIGCIIIAFASSRKQNNENSKNDVVSDDSIMSSDDETKKDDDISGNGKDDDKSSGVIKIWYSYKGYEKYIKSAIKDYKKENPDVEFRIEFISDPNYFNYINEKSLENEGPDIYLLGSEYLEKAYLLGILEENYDTDVINTTKYTDAAIASATFNSKVYAYPLGFDVCALITNTDVVNVEINTFEDIKKYADNFNNDETTDENLYDNAYENIYGYTYDDTAAYDVADENDPSGKIQSIMEWDAGNLLFNYGFIGKYISFESDGKKKVNIANTNTLSNIEEYMKLKDYFSVDASRKYEDIKTSFYNGNTAFILAGTDIINAMKKSKVNYDVSNLLDISSSNSCAGLSYTDLIAVNLRAQNKEAARAFAKYLSYDYAYYMYSKCGIISCRRDIEYDNNYISKFVKIYDESIVMPNILETEDFCITMEQAMRSIFNGEEGKVVLNKLQKKYDESID